MKLETKYKLSNKTQNFFKQNTKRKIQIPFSHLTVASSGLLLLLLLS